MSIVYIAASNGFEIIARNTTITVCDKLSWNAPKVPQSKTIYAVFRTSRDN